MDNSGTCNLNLPNSSVYARFIYIIRYLTRQGFYVIIDDHFNVDNLAQTDSGASSICSQRASCSDCHPYCRGSGCLWNSIACITGCGCLVRQG